MPIGDGTQTDRQKAPNLGSIFPPNYGQCSYSTRGHLSPILTKSCSKSLHNIAKILYLCKNFHATFMQKLICTRFAIGFKNGLPSTYTLKGQPRNTWLCVSCVASQCWVPYMHARSGLVRAYGPLHSVCRYQTTASRSIFWQFFVHAALARERAPKLNHYYPNAYFRIAVANSSKRSMDIGDGT